MKITTEQFLACELSLGRLYFIVEFGVSIAIEPLSSGGFVVEQECGSAHHLLRSREAVISYLSSGITPKDDKIKEAMAEIHNGEKMKAITLLAEALKL